MVGTFARLPLEEDGFRTLSPSREIGSGFEAASGRFCDRFHFGQEEHLLLRGTEMPSQEKRQQVSTEHQNGREGDNHQRYVVGFPRAVRTAIEDYRDNKDKHTTRRP